MLFLRFLVVTTASCLVPSILLASEPGYGVPVDGKPTWNERSLQVLTNACRMDPTGLRDNFVLVPDILTPAVYPKVAPVRWNPDLDRSSRFHADEMAGGCPFRHESCDGTDPFVRIRGYYTPPGKVGENIAGGHPDPLSTLIQWLRDDQGGIPSLDGSGFDGHRKNIMDGGYREVGCGYAQGEGSLHSYWVQDFGAGPSPFTSPIVDGTHQFAVGDETEFIMNYYDPAAKDPQSASLVLEGEVMPLLLGLGTASQGTYYITVATAERCRKFHFSATDGEGKAWRYPERGEFVTTLEGNCTDEYAGDAPANSQLAGDCTQDGVLDISDSLCLIGFQFLGSPVRLPCGGGGAGEEGNRALLDVNDDGAVDLTDAIHIINFLFLGGDPLHQGPGCLTIPDCPAVCAAP